MTMITSGHVDYQLTDVDRSIYKPVFLGGYPVKNQTNPVFTEGFNEKSNFGRKFVVLNEEGKEAGM